jgi:hypothetical protein
MHSSVRTVIFAAGILAPTVVVAQQEVVIKEYEAAMRQCPSPGKDRQAAEVCGFEAFVRFVPHEEVRCVYGTMLPYMAMAGGIRAAISSPADKAIEYLDAAIEITEDYHGNNPEDNWVLAPLHLYRAEACADVQNWDCFQLSAELLLSREIAIREDFLPRGEPGKSFRWSEISTLRARDGFSSDLGEVAEHDPRGTDFRARIDRVLTEAERRLQ